jgi:hypothetical protein
VKLSALIHGSVFLLLGMRSIAQQHPTCEGPPLGNWTLLSIETQDMETNQKNNLLGVHPSGYLSYGADCRMYTILTKESRVGPAQLVATDPESIALYRGLISYAGTYSIDGNSITQHIQASWNQAWTGTTQVLQFNIDGTSMYMRTGLTKNPLTGRQSSTTLIWTRTE